MDSWFEAYEVNKKCIVVLDRIANWNENGIQIEKFDFFPFFESFLRWIEKENFYIVKKRFLV